jgi:hypothetical protein
MSKLVFAFGRFNPVTTGHEVLMNKAKSIGGKDYRIYVSKSQDRKKNPLSYKDKIKYMRKIFPAHARNIVDSPARTAIDVAVDVHSDGYTDLIMIAGSDRVGEFQKLLDKYNGVKARHGEYKFDSIKVINAGERDPDAAGASGMSASKMRGAAADDDFDLFKTGLPDNFKDTNDALSLFRILQKAMGIKGLKEWDEKLIEEDKEYRLGAGATKKKIFQLIWTNPKGKKQKNWVKQLSKNSFQVLKKDGGPKETSTKTTDKFSIIMPDPGFKLKPAAMNNKYAELELETVVKPTNVKSFDEWRQVEIEGVAGRVMKTSAYKIAVKYFLQFKNGGDKPSKALHRAASTVKGVNDRDLQIYLVKLKLL